MSDSRLEPRRTADGSLTLWSERFGECFHSALGAHAEAISKYVRPAQLERFAAADHLVVLDLCVGLGYNSAALMDAAAERGLRIRWLGLELDPRPLEIALADAGYRGLWRTRTLAALQQLSSQGAWHQPELGSGRWWLGDARRTLPGLMERYAGAVDLVLHDAFSPQHCPELWSLELLAQLAGLLKPQGRLLTYCSAAAVRRGLELAGLELASISAPELEDAWRHWSGGTAASPAPLAPRENGSTGTDAVLRPLSAMEREHLLTRAAEPYRDPAGSADAATLRAEREERQRLHGGESTSGWRRRWGLDTARP
ncbi:MAG: hypothetical protein RLZZ219_1004 [Cyanobacteriota bacterium]